MDKLLALRMLLEVAETGGFSKGGAASWYCHRVGDTDHGRP
jgi:hypothetical protein